jgi:hypothetical protein
MRQVMAFAGAVAAALFAVVPAHAQKAAAQSVVTLKDAAGDVRGKDDDNLDVVAVGLDSDGKSLLVSATLAADVSALMSKRNASDALRMFIDTDDNPATGGEITWAAGRKGYDTEVDAYSCLKYANGEACMGGLGGKPTGYFTSYGIQKWKKQGDNGSFEMELMPGSEGSTGTAAGRTLKVAVPYAKLGLRAGQTIRVAVRESDGPYDATAVMADARLKLK